MRTFTLFKNSVFFWEKLLHCWLSFYRDALFNHSFYGKICFIHGSNFTGKYTLFTALILRENLFYSQSWYYGKFCFSHKFYFNRNFTLFMALILRDHLFYLLMHCHFIFTVSVLFSQYYEDLELRIFRVILHFTGWFINFFFVKLRGNLVYASNIFYSFFLMVLLLGISRNSAWIF